MDISTFLTVTGTTRPKRATARSIARAEAKIGRPLPASLRSFYEQTDGVDLTSLGGLRLLSLDALIEHHGGLKVWGIPDEWQYLPFAWCEGTSDRLCVSVHPALDGRLVFVPHDDGPRVAFPDVAHLLDAIVSAHRGRRTELLTRTADDDDDLGDDDLLGDDDDDFLGVADLPFWYRDYQERSTADGESAHRLLAQYQPRLRDELDVVAEQGVGFACELLAPTDVETLVGLIDVLGMEKRRALGRLRSIGSPAAESALADYHRSLAALGARLRAAATAAGHVAELQVGEYGEAHSLVLGRGAKARFLSVEYWYEHRNDDDLDGRFGRWLAERAR